MIDWNLFDKIYYVFGPAGEFEKSKLASLGLFYRENFRIYYQTDNCYYRSIFETMSQHDLLPNDKNSFKSVGDFGNTMTIYNLLQEAKYMRYGRVMIINNIDFNVNVNAVEKAVNGIPVEFDVISLTEHASKKDISSVEINDDYVKVNTFKNKVGITCLSDKAVNYVLQFQTQSLRPFDYYLSYRNTPRDYAIKRAACVLDIYA